MSPKRGAEGKVGHIAPTPPKNVGHVDQTVFHDCRHTVAPFLLELNKVPGCGAETPITGHQRRYNKRTKGRSRSSWNIRHPWSNVRRLHLTGFQQAVMVHMYCTKALYSSTPRR